MKTTAHIEELFKQYRLQIKKAMLCAKNGNIPAMKKRLAQAEKIEQTIKVEYNAGIEAMRELKEIKDKQIENWLDSLGL